MELSPKQQAVEQIKKAQKVLILGHKKPSGDMIGSGIALCNLLTEMGKKVEFVVSEPVPKTYNFLPLDVIQNKYEYLEGKLIRIDTSKIPVKGLKYQKHENFLDIILDSDKNLKFEFIEIKNSTEKPSLVIALDTPSLEKLDKAFKETPEVFVGVPIINIDHHSGNSFYGAVNLVDLTATSTAEILVSLFEALGSKLANQDTATALLTGIIEDTDSFQKSNTTPKSFTVAAQLLAAGARQQEIITHLFKKQSDHLMLLWREVTKNLKEDKKFALAWTHVSLPELNSAITRSDVVEATADLYETLNETDKLLVVIEVKKGSFEGILMGDNAEPLRTFLKAEKRGNYLGFKLDGETLENVEMNVLKNLADFWSKDNAPSGLWDVLVKEATDENLSRPETLEEIQEAVESFSEPATELDAEATGAKPVEIKDRDFITDRSSSQSDQLRIKKEKTFDPIDNALRSLAENQTETKGFTPLKDIVEKKKRDLGEKLEATEEIDVFDEENE